MTRTVRAVLAGVLIALTITGCTAERKPRCAAQASADAAAVRTDRHWTDKELPGIGDYLQIHWQARPLGDPCSDAPGPTDWEYEGVLQLRPDDMNSLVSHWNWAPDHIQPWPDVAQYTAKSASWLTAAAYDASLPGTLTTHVSVDAVHDTLLVHQHTT